jgi:hypothetical protein
MKVLMSLLCLSLAARSQSPVVVTRVIGLDYPWFARHNNIQGVVEVTVTITKEGLATNMRVAPGPPPALTDPVKEALGKWRFASCSECEARFAFTFVLSGECGIPDRCPTTFEVDLPGKVTVKAPVLVVPEF